MRINHSLKQPGRRLDLWISLGLTAAALGLYLTTLAPTVLEADAGEFQFVPWLPGIAHPTGYPFYSLLGWLWSHLLPLGEVAWRMNLLSALLAAVTVGLVGWLESHLLDRALPATPLPARRIAAAAAATLFAATPTFWSQAIIAEVYALHTLLVALVLWLALQGRSRWLAFILGVGLTHHVTIILLLPALLLMSLKAWRPISRPEPDPKPAGSILIHLGLFLLPLLLYLYLPLIAPVTPYAQLRLSDSQLLPLYENSFQGFWRHVSAAVFTGELRPAAVGLARLLMTWQLLLAQIGWVGLSLAFIGLMSLWRLRQIDLLLLTGVSFLTIVTFNLIYFIGDVFVLFIPAWLIACLWLGVGILTFTDSLAQRFIRSKVSPVEDMIAERMQARLGQNLYIIVSSLLPLFFFALPLWFIGLNFGQVDQSHQTGARTRWQEILAEPIPDAAILISNDRNEMMPMWYYQYVEQRRPDLIGLFPKIIPGPAYETVGRVLDQALVSGRPVYLIKPMEGLGLKVDLRPEGSLFRAIPWEGEPFYLTNLRLPEIQAAAGLTETVRLVGYDLEPPTAPEPGSEVTVTLYWQPAQPLSRDYTSYVHLVDSAGQGRGQNDQTPGGVFYPSSHWQVGERLRDRHVLAIPADTPPGLYRLRAGMYYQPEPGVIVGMGEGVEVGSLAIRDGTTAATLPPSQPIGLIFGDTILLQGYDVAPLADDQLLLNLRWEARSRQRLNWSVFVHLLDDSGNIVAQADGQPRDGTYPTTVWTVGEIVADSHLLVYPAGLRGRYQLTFGLYSPETGERLLITDSQGEIVGDHLALDISL